jgi:hypothetical protein
MPKKLTLNQINQIERNRRRVFKTPRNYILTFWPELFRLARLGLKAEDAMEQLALEKAIEENSKCQLNQLAR